MNGQNNMNSTQNSNISPPIRPLQAWDGRQSLGSNETRMVSLGLETIHWQVALPGRREGKMQNRTTWGPVGSKPEPHKGSVHVLTTLWFGTSSFRCGMSYLIQQLCIKLLEYNTAHAGN